MATEAQPANRFRDHYLAWFLWCWAFECGFMFAAKTYAFEGRALLFVLVLVEEFAGVAITAALLALILAGITRATREHAPVARRTSILIAFGLGIALGVVLILFGH